MRLASLAQLDSTALRQVSQTLKGLVKEATIAQKVQMIQDPTQITARLANSAQLAQLRILVALREHTKRRKDKRNAFRVRQDISVKKERHNSFQIHVLLATGAPGLHNMQHNTLVIQATSRTTQATPCALNALLDHTVKGAASQMYQVPALQGTIARQVPQPTSPQAV